MNYKYLLIGLLSIGLILSLIDSCNKGKENDKLSHELRQSDSIKNKLGQTVYSQAVQIAEKDDEIKKYSDSVFNLGKKHTRQIKEVHAFYASRTRVEIDSVLVPYEVTVKDKKWSDSVMAACRNVIDYYLDSTVRIGSIASDSTKFYNVSLKIQKEGVLINNIQFIDSQYIRIVSMKGGLFKKNIEGKRMFHVKQYMKVEVLHTNPYFKNEGINTIFVQHKSKFFKGVGTGIGVILLGLTLIK